MKIKILGQANKNDEFRYIARIELTEGENDQIIIEYGHAIGKTTLKNELQKSGANVKEEWQIKSEALNKR